MDVPEDRLAVARRLLDEARRLVEGQRIIVHRRQLAGLDTELSEDVLRTFEQSLVMFGDDLARLSTNSTAALTGRHKSGQKLSA